MRTDKIKVAFARFYESFEPTNNVFYRLLSKHYEVDISDDPEFVFYSLYEGEMPKGEYVKIFYNPEPYANDSNSDWTFSFLYDEELNDPRHLRLPNYALQHMDHLLNKEETFLNYEKSKFCNFIYSKANTFRNTFFKRLSKYKKIDSPGVQMNNIPAIKADSPLDSRLSNNWMLDKITFQRAYKFTIAFENKRMNGYTTEKIYHAMLAGTIPIYYGNPLVGRDFNTKSFINYHDYEKVLIKKIGFLLKIPVIRRFARLFIEYKTTKKVISEVIRADKNPEVYEAYLKAPFFHNNRPSKYVNIERLESRLIEIVEEGKSHS